MVQYLIEFRFHGKAKFEIKKLIFNINKKYKLRTKRTVPHITLVGPFTTNDEKKLISEFNDFCSNHTLMDFEINGFDNFEDNKVIYLNIKPSEELEKFRWGLSKRLQSFCNLKSYDYDESFVFHSTIALKIPYQKYIGINEYVKKTKIKFKHKLIRVTLLKNGLILREYDFLLNKSLSRKEAKSKNVYNKTMNLFNNTPIYNTPKSLNLIDKIMSFFKKPKIFITSDLHLGHRNIIKYCNRPFSNIKEMNHVLVRNWNEIISNRDTVYFLGDLSYGKNTSTDCWYKKLNENIIFIKGNHDISNTINLYENYILEYKRISFYLCHVPEDVPSNWNGWIISGHFIITNLKSFLFLIGKTKELMFQLN